MSRRRGGRQLDGVLLVNKPKGPTSFDIVKRVRQALDVRKAGHTGTLDPMATGLLVICLGRATRLVQFLTAQDKRYQGTVRLGIATDTLDAEGAVTHQDDDSAVAQVDQAAFEAVLPGFRGVIEQRPPAYSAIKVNGRRLHELARAGEAVEAPLRTIEIFSLIQTPWKPPEFKIEVHSSKGTYIRSLAADIGTALGLGAHLSALHRTSVGPFQVVDALSLEALEADPESAVSQCLSLSDALHWMPTVVLDEVLRERVRNGQRCVFSAAPAGLCRAIDEAGQLIAIIEARGDAPAPVVRGFC